MSTERTFYVRCQQDIAPKYGVFHIEEVEATSGQEALEKVRDMFLPRLRRETVLTTCGPRGALFKMTITLTEIKQAREPKYEQLDLFS